MLSLLPPITSSFTESNDQLTKTIDTLYGSIQVLNDETQNLSSKVKEGQSLVESVAIDLSNLKIAIEETNAFAKALEPNQRILRQNLNSLTEKTENQLATSYDGTLLWRITDVQQKMGMYC
ncbi:hypothetical protein I4U23_006186 [Adineta vaga]|nr:hypothetical protein I4U23_006186 [Adineta vaga]